MYCRPRQESRAEAHLENQGFRVFLPRLRSRFHGPAGSRVRVEPLFPRYLFMDLCEFAQDWSTIRSTRGVVGLVRFGDRFPTVGADFIEVLRRRHDECGAIDMSRACELTENDPVEITDGALAGLRAIYKATSSEERVVVLLDMLNHSRRIEIPRDHLRKAV